MPANSNSIAIVGGGLAGTECALQLAKRGHKVTLFEMRQAGEMTPAHTTKHFAELVCSNSLGSCAELSAHGQLKWEAGQLGSELLQVAYDCRVPAGQALAVDREEFAKKLTERILSNPNIHVESRQISSLNELPRPAVLATGPLTSNSLATSLAEHIGKDFLFFYDAIAPVISADSIDMSIAWKADRYDKGDASYLNCPLNEEEYFELIQSIKKAEKVEPKSFESTKYFEGCLPVEVIVERSDLGLAFGPMKPVGLKDPRTGERPFAVVQLRQENKECTSYNLVGFQTKMTYPEQKKVFRKIPGLEKAEFLKLGSIHRNLYVNANIALNPDLSSKKDDSLFLAGQITGVEGYFESICMGLLVGLFLDRKLNDQPPLILPRETALGSLLHAITQNPQETPQPTNMNFGLFPPIEGKWKKLERREQQILRAKQKVPAAPPFVDTI